MNITHELRRVLQVNSCATTASDAARDVSGQVLGTRVNEIYLFRSLRPIRSLPVRSAGPRRRLPSTPCRRSSHRSCRSTARSTRSPRTLC